LVSTQTSTTPTTPTVRRLHCATLPYISIHPARLLARALLSFSFFSHASFLVSTTVLMSTTAQQQQWFGAMVAMVAAAIGFGSLDTLAELATAAPATAALATPTPTSPPPPSQPLPAIATADDHRLLGDARAMASFDGLLPAAVLAAGLG
jgi:hypothetical protein